MAGEVVRVTYVLNDKMSRQLKLIQKTSGLAEQKLVNMDKQVHKIATSNDPKNFGQNVTRALDRVNRALNNTTGGFKSMQGTVKNTFAQQTRLKNVFDNATSSIRAQHKETVNYNRAMNQGVSSMNKAAGAADKYNGILNQFRDNERKARQESDKKTESVKGQGRGFDQAGRSGNNYNGILGRLISNESRYRSVLREVADYSFFRDGFESGARMFQTTTKLLGILPALASVIGVVGQAMNGLVAGASAAGGSLINLAGILGALPGLFAAGGVAAAGLASIMGAIVEPSMKNVPKLEDAQERVTEATQRISDAQQKVIDAQDKINSAQRDLLEAENMATDQGTTVDEYNRVLDAQQRMKDATEAQVDAGKGLSEQQRELANAQKEFNDLQAQTPARAKELYDEVQNTKTAWMQLWQNAGTGEGIISVMIEGLRLAQTLMKVFAPQADNLVDSFERMANTLFKIFSDPNTQDWMGSAIDQAIVNFESMFNLAVQFLPLFQQLLSLSQTFTATLLEDLGIWSDSVTQAENVEAIVASIGAWMERGRASFKNWAKILANFGVAFNNIFQAANPQRFESDLLGVARTFRDWTETNTDGITAFMDRSYTIFKALGRLVLNVAKAFGVLSTEATTGETVAFLDQLGRGIIAFAGYAQRSITTVGPQLRAFFSALGEAMGGNVGDAMIEATGNILKFGAALVEVFNSLPTPLIAFILQMRVYMLALGFAAGTILGPIARLDGILAKFFARINNGVGIIGKIGPKLKNFYKLLAGGRTGLAGFSRAFGIVGLAIGVVMGMVDALRSNFGGIRDSIMETVDGLQEQLGPAFARLGEAIGGEGGFGAALKFVGKALGTIFKVVGAVALKIIQFVAILGGNVLGAAVNIITLIVNQFKLMWEFWKKFVSAIASGDIKGAFGAIWDYIKGTFSNLTDFIGNMWSNLMDTMMNMLKAVGVSVIGFIAMPFENAINSVIDTVNKAIGQVNRLLPKSKEIGKVGQVSVVSDFINEQKAARTAEAQNRALGLDRGASGAERGAAASGARYAAMAEAYGGKKAPKAKAKKKPATNQKAIQGLTTTQGIAGYTQTGGQGAEVKWNMATVNTFNATTDTIKAHFVDVGKVVLRLPKHVATGITGAIDAIKSKTPAFAQAADDLAKAFYEPFHKWLTKAIEEVNNVITAAGGTPVNINASSGGGGAAGGRRRAPAGAIGDAPAGISGLTGGFQPSGATGASTGVNTDGINWNGHPSNVVTSLLPYVKKGIDQGLQVTSTTDLKHAPNSKHYSGLAVDLSNGSAPTAEMDRYYNMLVPAAKAGMLSELIYKHNGWFGGTKTHYSPTDHFNHIHLAVASAASDAIFGAGGDAADIPNAPDFGNSQMGQAYQGLAAMATTAMASLMGGTPMENAHGPVPSGADLEKASPAMAKRYAQSLMGQYGWGPEQWGPLDKLWTRESNWKWSADNPSSDAYGIPQSLPGSKMASKGANWQTNAGTQIQWGLDYIKGRYRTPSAAWEHSERVNWYGNGGSFRTKKPHLIGVGEKGPEDVTITPARGRKGRGRGEGRGTVINSNVHVGTLIADDAGIEMLAERVGGVFVNDLRRARGATPREEA